MTMVKMNMSSHRVDRRVVKMRTTSTVGRVSSSLASSSSSSLSSLSSYSSISCSQVSSLSKMKKKKVMMIMMMVMVDRSGTRSRSSVLPHQQQKQKHCNNDYNSSSTPCRRSFGRSCNLSGSSCSRVNGDILAAESRCKSALPFPSTSSGGNSRRANMNMNGHGYGYDNGSSTDSEESRRRRTRGQIRRRRRRSRVRECHKSDHDYDDDGDDDDDDQMMGPYSFMSCKTSPHTLFRYRCSTDVHHYQQHQQQRSSTSTRLYCLGRESITDCDHVEYETAAAETPRISTQVKNNNTTSDTTQHHPTSINSSTDIEHRSMHVTPSAAVAAANSSSNGNEKNVENTNSEVHIHAAATSAFEHRSSHVDVTPSETVSSTGSSNSSHESAGIVINDNNDDTSHCIHENSSTLPSTTAVRSGSNNSMSGGAEDVSATTSSSSGSSSSDSIDLAQTTKGKDETSSSSSSSSIDQQQQQQQQQMETALALERKFKLWVAAIKLPIFSVAVVPLAVGASLAFGTTGVFFQDRFLELCCGSICIIAWLNLSNDGYDADTGVDVNKPESVVNLTSGNRNGVLLCAWLFFAVGVALIAHALLFTIPSPLFISQRGATCLGLLCTAIACGWAYQCPPFRLSYRGYGEKWKEKIILLF